MTPTELRAIKRQAYAEALADTLTLVRTRAGHRQSLEWFDLVEDIKAIPNRYAGD